MTAALELYDALKSIGVDEARARSTAEKLDAALERRLTRDLSNLATREELGELGSGLRGEMGELRTELRTGMAELREGDAGIRQEMARLETRLIKWNVGTILAVAALTMTLVKLLG